MYHLKLPSQILILFVMLLCVSTVPYNRFGPFPSSKPFPGQHAKYAYHTSANYMYSLPFNEKPDDLQEADGWLVTDLSDNPFLSFTRPRPPSGLPAVNSHHMEKRNCNTATCVTQRLADFLIRSSNTIGTVYVPTNVGANTYGKRDLLQSPIYLPL